MSFDANYRDKLYNEHKFLDLYLYCVSQCKETDINAFLAAAECYRLGLGTTANIDKAMYYYFCASELGSLEARANLAYIKITSNFEKKLDKYISMLYDAYRDGYAPAYTMLVQACHLSEKVSSADKIKIFEQAAAQGIPCAYRYLGILQKNDDQLEAAIENFTKGVKQGDVDCLFLLCSMTKLDESNLIKYIDFMKREMKRGNAQAALDLAKLELDGKVSLTDQEAAICYMHHFLEYDSIPDRLLTLLIDADADTIASLGEILKKKILSNDCRKKRDIQLGILYRDFLEYAPITGKQIVCNMLHDSNRENKNEYIARCCLDRAVAIRYLESIDENERNGLLPRIFESIYIDLTDEELYTAIDIMFSLDQLSACDKSQKQLWYELGKQVKHPKALYTLGSIQEHDKNFDAARELYEQSVAAAPETSYLAMQRLGAFYLHGMGSCSIDEEKAIYYLQIASKGDNESMYKLAEYYKNHPESGKTPSEICQMYEQAAASGKKNHLLCAAEMYIFGNAGEPVNIDRGLELLNTLLNSGYPPALFLKAKLYEYGIAEYPKSLEEARNLYDQAETAMSKMDSFKNSKHMHACKGAKLSLDEKIELATLLETAGTDGDKLYKLGVCYEVGIGTDDANPELALEYFCRAAECGNQVAMNKVGMYPYLPDINASLSWENSDSENLRILKALAGAGNEQAVLFLALCYITGRFGVEKDINLALELLKPLSLPSAAIVRADCYKKLGQTGTANREYLSVVEADTNGFAELNIGFALQEYGQHDAAKTFFESSAKKENIHAMFALSEINHDLALLRKAAEAQLPEAILKYAYVLSGNNENYDYSSRSEANSMELYHKAAFLGSSEAMIMYGTQLEKSCQTVHAMTWYERAMRLGNNNACSYAAEIYRTGKGDYPRDIKKAMELYEKAADAGVAYAKYKLAMLLKENALDDNDFAKIRELIEAAAQQHLIGAVIEAGNMYKLGLYRAQQDIAKAVYYYRLRRAPSTYYELYMLLNSHPEYADSEDEILEIVNYLGDKADNLSPEAKETLAQLYETGTYLAQDKSKAERLRKEASGKNSAPKYSKTVKPGNNG